MKLTPLRLEIVFGNWHFGMGLVHTLSEEKPAEFHYDLGTLLKVTRKNRAKPALNAPEEPQVPPDEKATFCRTCGKELVGRVEPAGYDVHTGEPIVVAFAVCPDLAYTTTSVNENWEGQRFFCDQ
jgi:hypothetical protein